MAIGRTRRTAAAYRRPRRSRTMRRIVSVIKRTSAIPTKTIAVSASADVIGSPATENGLHPRAELLRAERLADVIVRPGVEPALDVGLLAPRSEQDDRHLARRFVLAETPCHLEAVHLRHHHVEDREIRPRAPSKLERLSAVTCLEHRVARALETEDDQLEDVLVVVRGEDNRLFTIGLVVRHVVTSSAEALTAAGSANGRPTVNVVPTPALLLKEIVPPCASTIAFVIERPRPVPWMFLAVEARKKRSNSRWASSSGMPTPVSLTSSCAVSPDEATVTKTSPPSGVNLTAFESRLSTTCVSLEPSAKSCEEASEMES